MAHQARGRDLIILMHFSPHNIGDLISPCRQIHLRSQARKPPLLCHALFYIEVQPPPCM